MKTNAVCTNIFKPNSGKTLSVLWVEIINHMEQTKPRHSIENPGKMLYTSIVQSCTCQSKNGEVSDI